MDYGRAVRQQVNIRIEALTTLLEPIMIVIMGVYTMHLFFRLKLCLII